MPTAYVHSNLENYKKGSSQSKIQTARGEIRLNSEIEQIITQVKDLANQIDEYIDSDVENAINNLMNNGDYGVYQKAIATFFSSTEARDILTQDISLTKEQAEGIIGILANRLKDKKYSGIKKALLSIIKESTKEIGSNQLKNKIIEAICGKNRSVTGLLNFDTGKAQFDFFVDAYGVDNVAEQFGVEIKKKLVSKSNNIKTYITNLYEQLINDYSKKDNSILDSFNTNIETLYSKAEEYLTKTFQNENHIDGNLDGYLNALQNSKSSSIKMIKKFYVGNAEATGDLAEKIIPNTSIDILSDGKEVEVCLTTSDKENSIKGRKISEDVSLYYVGQTSENVLREIKELNIKGDISNIKDPSKQSYTDLILMINGKPIRIQVKGYGLQREAFYKKAKDKYVGEGYRFEKKIPLFHGPMELEEFLYLLNNSGNSLIGDVSIILENLANSSWFSTHQSFKHKEGYEPFGPNNPPISSKYQRTLEAFLIDAVLNYLGIVLDSTTLDDPTLGPKVDLHKSNIYYWEYGTGLVKTSEALRGVCDLIENGLRNWNKEVASVKVSIKDGQFKWNDAAKFYKEKLKNWCDLSHIQSVGQEQADSYLATTSINGVNLVTNLGELFKDAFSSAKI